MSSNAALLVIAALLCLHAASAYRLISDSVVDEKGHVVGKLVSNKGVKNEAFFDSIFIGDPARYDFHIKSWQDCEAYMCGGGYFTAWLFEPVDGFCAAFNYVPIYEPRSGWVRGWC